MKRRNLFVLLGTFCLGLVVIGSRANSTYSASGPTVAITVQATDSSGGVVHYRWKSTDGSINDVNSPTTSWTLPNGPGLHFAYVLVSNGRGGYTERRIAVNTDTIATVGTDAAETANNAQQSFGGLQSSGGRSPSRRLLSGAGFGRPRRFGEL